MHPDDPNTAADTGRCPDGEPMHLLAFIGVCAAVVVPPITATALLLVAVLH